jgi:hypothetical protein
MNTSEHGWIPKVEVRSRRGMVYVAAEIPLLGAAVLVAATLLAANRQTMPAISRGAPVNSSPAGLPGACCDPATGECEDAVYSWVCTARGDTFQGDGTLCAACNGGPRVGLPCRTCSNVTSTFCTKDSDCPPTGNCQLDPSKCPSTSGVCSTGLVGNECMITVPPAVGDDSCDLFVLCDLSTLTCAAGNVGQACTLDIECDVQGTCVAVSCQAIAACAQGACCDPATAACRSRPRGLHGPGQRTSASTR